MTDLDLSKVTWGEFLIGDLFEINSSKKIIHSRSVKTKEVNKGTPYIVRKTSNNGVKLYIDPNKINKSYLNEGHTLSFAQDSFITYYQEKEYITGNKIKILKPKNNITKNSMIFISTSINKSISKLKWGDGSTTESIKNTKLKLPVTKDGNIDYDFMDRYVENIKEHYYKNRKEILEQNIKKKMEISEISDLNLTEDETKAILKMKNNKVQWGEFLIGDLFEINSSKKIIHSRSVKTKEVNKGTPYIVRKTSNNGVKLYIDPNKINKSYLNEGHTLSFAQDSFITYYQEKEYITGNKIKILKPKNNITKNSMIFISTSINKSISKLKWGDGSTTESIKNTKLKLPVTDDGSIDYEFMELYTKAMHKYIIKKEIIKNEQYMKHLKTLTYKGD